MELPDFMSYANKFSQSDFVEKISRILLSGLAQNWCMQP